MLRSSLLSLLCCQLSHLPLAACSLRLVLLKARLLAHLGEFERAIDCYNVLVEHTFTAEDGVSYAQFGRSGHKSRPVFPLKKYTLCSLFLSLFLSFFLSFFLFSFFHFSFFFFLVT
jgi:hypothetical protein